MSNVNQHIETYLDYYLNSKFNPRFAVMLHGEWGCGKTWFIRNYTKNYIEQNKNNRKFKNPFLFISLYGVSYCDEIDSQILQQIHPIFSSKEMALVGKFSKKILQNMFRFSVPKIDLNDLPDYLKNTKDRILIFDDLERCHLSIEAVLGHINYFVETQEMKVIILANENEIDKTSENTENTAGKYRRIKEKLIGQSFKVHFDFHAALDFFLEEIRTPDLQNFLKEQTEKILEIFKLASYRNLRHLQQSLWDFELLYLNMEPKFQENQKLLEDLLRIFLVFSIEIKAGKISSSDIGNLDDFWSERTYNQQNNQDDRLNQQGKEQESKSNLEIFLEKYDCIEKIFDLEIWCEFFEKGFFPRDRITEILEKSKYYENENRPIWVKLWHYTDLEDEEFESLLKEALEHRENYCFKIPGEILQISGLLLLFSKHGLYSKRSSEIIEESKVYIQTIKDKGILEDFERNDWKGTSWKGLGYQPRENESRALSRDFKEIYYFLDQKIKEFINDGLPEKGKYLLRLLKEDFDDFLQKIAPWIQSSEQFYFKNPVFKGIEPETFFNVLLELNNAQIIDLGSAIRSRYSSVNSDSILIEELLFLRALDSLLAQGTESRKGKLKGVCLESLRTNFIREAIQRLESMNKPDLIGQIQQNSAEN